MIPKRFQVLTILLFVSLTTPVITIADDQPQTTEKAERLPNVVVIFIDDLGYADIGPFGATAYPTPNLDQMAREGRKFTDFVTATAVCSASRAALLTGCYNARLGIFGAYGPRAKRGLNPNEVTLAELCKQKGYATACFGKWHLGNHPKFMPLNQGFDEYYGLPYSNDMWPLHPGYAELPADAVKRKHGYPDLPLYKGNEIIDDEVSGEDQAKLTTDYTNLAVDFIERNKSNPFFLYVPHSMVHVPLFVSEKFKGKSGAGLFGDVMMEVDWSVGEIVRAIKKHKLEEDTLIVFTSDNGPWLSYGDHAGSARPLREGKGTMFEGGYRVPTIMQWHGKIPANSSCDELCSTIDLFPTTAAMIGGKLPDHEIDGKDIRPLMFGETGAKSPHDAFYCYYRQGELHAVRDRRFKLHVPHTYQTLNGAKGGTKGKPVKYQQAKIETELYDLKNDVGETTNVADKFPSEVERLMKLIEIGRAELGDKLTNTKGSGVRPVGQVD